MGFLTEDERAGMQIQSMILHVVGPGEFEPQPDIPVEQEPFFVKRILEADIDAVYRFSSRSKTRDSLRDIASGLTSFASGAQALSERFAELHQGAMVDGALFVFELRFRGSPDNRVYSFIKFDYQEVLQRVQSGSRNFRKIIDALADDKKAVQKSALVRVRNGRVQSLVATQDRSKRSPLIADYFATFLGAERSRSDTELTKSADTALQNVLSKSIDDLPGKDVGRALWIARNALRIREKVDEAAILEAVLAAADNPEDKVVCERLKRRTEGRVKAEKLSGLEFKPDRRIFKKPARRRIRTTEGVVLVYPDEADGASVKRDPTPDGGEIITVTTDRVIKDEYVSDRTR